MDFKKLLRDIATLNFTDLNKRFAKVERKLKRIVFTSFNKLPETAEIPVLINNRDRLSYLSQLISRLEEIGFKNIIIIDNDSTYPPLLNYYSKTKHTVIYLKRNGGPRSIWQSPELKKYIKQYYIYTDPDVVPEPAVTMETIKDMLTTLSNSLMLEKIGLGLRIDNLPDHFALKNQVIDWEKQFHQNRVSPNYFAAPVDTTFALYAPFEQGGGECKAYRTVAPFEALHLPWYENSSIVDEETKYYRDHAATDASHWTELTRQKA